MRKINKQGLNVMSLFNGMGTLRQALSDMNIKVNTYYSSEIKPYAIRLQQHHFPDVIQVGDIHKWKEWDVDWKSIDFIGSGSPCQDLTISGTRAGLDGERSKVFWVFIEILNHVKSLNPNVLFLQENVASAPKSDVGIMSKAMGLYPVKINSKRVVAQLRNRYYWTNIRTIKTMFDITTDIPQPEVIKTFLRDIITEGTVTREKHTALLESSNAGYKDVFREKTQINLKVQIDIAMATGIYLDDGTVRLANKVEMCRLQGFADDYCEILTERETCSLLGDGWTLPIIKHILSFMKITKN